MDYGETHIIIAGGMGQRSMAERRLSYRPDVKMDTPTIQEASKVGKAKKVEALPVNCQSNRLRVL